MGISVCLLSPVTVKYVLRLNCFGGSTSSRSCSVHAHNLLLQTLSTVQCHTDLYRYNTVKYIQYVRVQLINTTRHFISHTPYGWIGAKALYTYVFLDVTLYRTPQNMAETLSTVQLKCFPRLILAKAHCVSAIFCDIITGL